MLARVFDKTRRFLSRSPSVPGRNSESRDTPPNDAPDVDDTMVTTRGGTETPGAKATPRSSAKERAGKRELDSLDTPTQAKRLKKTSPKSKETVTKALLEPQIPTEEALQDSVEATPEPETYVGEPVQKSVEGDSDTIHVVIKSSEGPVAEGELPIRRRSSPIVVIPNVSPSGATASHEHIPTTPTLSLQRDVEGSATPKAQVTEILMATEKDDDSNTLEVSQTTTRFLNEVPSSTCDSMQEEMPTAPEKQEEPDTIEISQTSTRTYDEIPSPTYDSEQDPIASQEHAVPSSQPPKDHVRFGSEEPTSIQDTVIPSLPAHAPQDEPVDDSASDSDEAPEIVTTATAIRTAKSYEQTALRASAAQAAAQEAKRQAREARLAEERAQKRLRDEKKAKKLARQLKKQEKSTPLPADEDLPTIPTATKAGLPALLPDSLLASISAQRPPTPPPQRRGKTDEERRQEKLNHHIKFLERAEKPAKDVKKGKLSVAVLGPRTSVLPPKVNRDTRNVREQWLKGRTVEKKKGGKKNHVFGKVERRGHGKGGFLRGED